ncbi:SRPBCC family protein [Paenibacillus contaminans]|uniref:SRPBCC domain-containing protein n=1 Tax=Paenibacillus contaminans TaxID=450362 RepID=A0A329LVP8_9BACL|nr:SRPBCC domain-containing protein [Paenibacillus contaminans]RAV11879.1 SRPBCC domain-containing protein [Paenibacillus contaminans]
MTQNSPASSLTTKAGEREFSVERMFNAPRELVFQAFTQPEHLSRWWAPGGYTIPVCNIDLRPGGVWHYSMRSPQGDEHWVKAIYREIVAPERIVYTCTFADEHANPTDDIPEQLATMTFAEYEGRTKLNIVFQFKTAKELKETLDMGMIAGLTETLNSLDGLLAGISAGNVPLD